MPNQNRSKNTIFIHEIFKYIYQIQHRTFTNHRKYVYINPFDAAVHNKRRAPTAEERTSTKRHQKWEVAFNRIVQVYHSLWCTLVYEVDQHPYIYGRPKKPHTTG